MWIPSDYFFEQSLLELSECGASYPFSGVLCQAYLGLAIAPVPGINRATILSQFVEASYPGYARLPLNWRLPYFGSNNLWDLEAVCDHFAPTANDPNQLIQALFIASAVTGGQLLMSMALPLPGIDMSDIQDALTVVVRFGMDPLANWGDATLIS